jgi:hypothetical protein
MHMVNGAMIDGGQDKALMDRFRDRRLARLDKALSEPDYFE